MVGRSLPLGSMWMSEAASPEGVDDDLVGQLDDGAVRFVGGDAAVVVGAGLLHRPGVGAVVRQLLQDQADVAADAVGLLDAGDDLVLETDVEHQLPIRVQRAQGIGAGEVAGVVDDHDQLGSLALDRDGAGPLQEVDPQAGAEVLGDALLAGETIEIRLVEAGQRLLDLRARDPHFLQQVAGGIGLGGGGIGQRPVQGIGGQGAGVHQAVPGGGPPVRARGQRGAVQVGDGGGQQAADLVGGSNVGGGEGMAVAAVDDLEQAQQVLVVDDRQGQHRAGAETAGLVPARVEAQARVDTPELGGVVDVGDVDRRARDRHEPGDAGGLARDPDLLELVAALDQ